MTISELATLGSLLASIAVMITVIYLAKQVKQNTISMKNGQSQHFVESNIAIINPLVTDPELTRIWISTGTVFTEANAVDQQRVLFFEFRAISAWNHYFHMHKKGLVEDHLWVEMLWLFRTMGQRQSVHEAWKIFRPAYTSEFQVFMDQYLQPRSP